MPEPPRQMDCLWNCVVHIVAEDLNSSSSVIMATLCFIILFYIFGDSHQSEASPPSLQGDRAPLDELWLPSPPKFPSEREINEEDESELRELQPLSKVYGQVLRNARPFFAHHKKRKPSKSYLATLKRLKSTQAIDSHLKSDKEPFYYLNDHLPRTDKKKDTLSKNSNHPNSMDSLWKHEVVRGKESWSKRHKSDKEKPKEDVDDHVVVDTSREYLHLEIPIVTAHKGKGHHEFTEKG